ncbi:MAG: hypothetical protein QOD12_113, partial [Verrucomicrobiota bacterium]
SGLNIFCKLFVAATALLAKMPLSPWKRKKPRLEETTINAQFSLCCCTSKCRMAKSRPAFFVCSRRPVGDARAALQGGVQGHASHSEAATGAADPPIAIVHPPSTILNSQTGGIAQLVERQLCKLDVRGSNPLASKCPQGVRQEFTTAGPHLLDGREPISLPPFFAPRKMPRRSPAPAGRRRAADQGTALSDRRSLNSLLLLHQLRPVQIQLGERNHSYVLEIFLQSLEEFRRFADHDQTRLCLEIFLRKRAHIFRCDRVHR